MGLKLCPIDYSSHQGGTSNQRPSDDSLSIKGKDNGSECLLYPYLYCETKIKSPINNVGINDPEGILKGWKKTVLINIAIKPAEKIIFKASHLLSLVKTIYRTKSNSKIIDNCINYYFFKKLIITLETT